MTASTARPRVEKNATLDVSAPKWWCDANNIPGLTLTVVFLEAKEASLVVWSRMFGKKLYLPRSLVRKGEMRLALVTDAGNVRLDDKSFAANAFPFGRIYVAQDDIIVEGTPFDLANRCRQVIGGRWNKHNLEKPMGQMWYYPKTDLTAAALEAAFIDTQVDRSDPLLREMVERAKQYDVAGAAKLAAEHELSQPEFVKLRLWLHQLRAFHFAKNMFGAALFMDMGTGKSLVLIALIMNLTDVRFALIAAPLKVVKNVWPGEFMKHCAVPVTIAPLWKGSVEDRVQALKDALAEGQRTGTKVVAVVNYEMVFREPFATFIQATPPDLLACDESHKIKGPTGAAAKTLHKLAKKVRRRYLLTGTPMPHDPLDIWSQYMVMDGGATFGESFHRFRNRYAVLGGYGGKQIMEWQREDELQDLMYKSAFRVTEDVVKLPPKTFNVVYGDLSAEEWRAYNEMEEELLLLFDETNRLKEKRERLEDYTALWESEHPGQTLNSGHRAVEHVESERKATASIVLVKLLRLAQITSGFVMDTERAIIPVGTSKLKLLLDTMEDIKRDEPVAIFVRFVADLDRIGASLRKAGYKVCELSGRVDQMADFKAGAASVILVQLQAGGVGIDLTRCGDRPCRYAIYYSKDFNWGNYQQSLKRIHRPGQTETTHFITLVMTDTVDQKVEDVLAGRGDLIESVLEVRGRLDSIKRGRLEDEPDDDEEEEMGA